METAIWTNNFLEENREKALNLEQSVQYEVNEKHSSEILFTVQNLRDIKQILIKVSDANDFVEILCEIMKMKEENRISKEQIDGMKSKWRQYKMTKKQIVNIYELL